MHFIQSVINFPINTNSLCSIKHGTNNTYSELLHGIRASVTYVIFFPPSPIKSIPSNTGRLYPSPNPHHLLNSLISIPSSSLGIITFYGYLKSFLPLKVGTCSGMLMGLIVAHLQLLSQPKMGLRSSLPTQLTFTGPCRIN